MHSVRIKIADRGWILEKCASEIARADAMVSYGTDDDPTALVQYYLNYSAYRGRVSPIEVGFFTHSERDPGARARYFAVAESMDHCVCMSELYARELRDHGIAPSRISVIAPGVDLDAFRPKVRIGVVGRTYHTGRKGEALVAEVMDIPGIEWHFTGSGWPGPSQPVADEAMPDFYNGLDYVLVPALYEGGPMSVLEGLACGKPIIASAVGWVGDYPHIPFENGNAASLRAVLEGLVNEREALRQSVLHRGWDAWAQENLALFARLMSGHTGKPAQVLASPYRDLGAVLITHGAEGITLGGPSVRVPATVQALRAKGVRAELVSESIENFSRAPVAHVFNVWHPTTCQAALARARSANKAVVLSPIFLDLSRTEVFSKMVPSLLENLKGGALVRMLSELAAQIRSEPNLPMTEIYPGYHDEVAAVVHAADHVICLSEHEARCLDHIGAVGSRRSIIRNAVDPGRFAGADPDLFRKAHGLDDYILCVGRIEPRKNQAMLAEAARRMGRKVVFIGHDGTPAYAGLARERAGDAGLFISRINPDDPMLASAFAGASVFALPSWSEGAPLAALEAAAAGAPLVLSDRSSEAEYFGERARYVNPADLDGMMAALDAAMAEATPDRAASQQAFVRRTFDWSDHATQTAEVYRSVIDRTAQPGARTHKGDAAALSLRTSLGPGVDASAIPCAEGGGKIYFDLTSSAYFNGMPTGIARVERVCYEELAALHGNKVVPIVWSNSGKGFFKIDPFEAMTGINRKALQGRVAGGPGSLALEEFAPGSRIVVMGGAWIRNEHYIQSLGALRQQSNVPVVLLVHDLIQMTLPHLYPDDAGAIFEANAKRICALADAFLVYSDASRRDLVKLLHREGQILKPVLKFRIGDFTDLAEPTTEIPTCVADYAGKDFVVFVSSLDMRKNHQLLLNVWRRLIRDRGANVPYLLFIGRPIWEAETIVNQLAKDKALASRVHHLTQVDDEGLDWLYRNCLFTVFPSLYEGWGLPIAESLAYGKMCITTTGSSTEEVAPTLTDLLDPYDFRAWLDRVSLYIDNPALLAKQEQKIAQQFQPRAWSDAVREISGHLSALETMITPHRRPIMPNTVLQFNRSSATPESNAILQGGWSANEGSGCWSLQENASIRFEYAGLGKESLIRLRLRGLPCPDERRPMVRIAINGTELACVRLDSQFSLVDVPLAGILTNTGRRDLTLSLHMDALVAPVETGIGTDSRRLGVLLNAVAFAESQDQAEQLLTANRPPTAGAPSTTPAPAPAPNAMASLQSEISVRLSAQDIAVVEDHLRSVRRNSYLPERLPANGFATSVLRSLKLDRPALRGYSRMFARTNDSILRLSDVLERLIAEPRK